MLELYPNDKNKCTDLKYYINSTVNNNIIIYGLNTSIWKKIFPIKSVTLVQLGLRYEGQLNPMAEPISHEVRPLVRTHVYHPYHAADRQAETDSWV